MLYTTIEELPLALRHLPLHTQEILRVAFNAAWQSYADRVAARQGELASRVAWAAVKKQYRKSDGLWLEK